MKNNRLHRIPTILVVILVVFLGFNIYLSYTIILEDVVDGMTYSAKNTSKMTASCDRYYNKRYYGDLYDYLRLYNLEGEAYDKYWEICDGYLAYIEYEYCSEEEKASKKEVLQSLADKVQYSENRSTFTKWLEE